MVIDCERCSERGVGCADCVVTFLTIPVRPAAGPPRGVELDDTERRAIDALAASGLVPPLRLVRAV